MFLFAFTNLYSNDLWGRANSNPNPCFVLFFTVCIVSFVNVGENPINWGNLGCGSSHMHDEACWEKRQSQQSPMNPCHVWSAPSPSAVVFSLSVYKLSLRLSLSPRLLHRQREHRRRKYRGNDGLRGPGFSHNAPCHKEPSFRKTPPISQRYKQILQLSSPPPPLQPWVQPLISSRRTSHTQLWLQHICLWRVLFFLLFLFCVM